ncbi:alpha/beta hydrolase family protein [Tenacibaculum sp. ZS6-P6]|uniref:alpha/beta hydrolase family protein n=1 Tax=Tenacibaculum sp. ZS6-P6 TaxID=3447503 RepID=UPI003F95B656
MIRLLLLLFLFFISSFLSIFGQSKKRPQDPVAPFSYQIENVTFKSGKADFKLAGTLTLPKDKRNPPVAILISGSGPQNRNSEIKQFNHRPFLVLSDYLTNNGIAVLRFDDRGIAESEGEFKGATSHDFADDVLGAIAFLKTKENIIDTKKIGLIGHSEGSLIAAITASQSEDLAFVVSLAGPGVDGAEILLTQSRKAMELRNVPVEFINTNEKLASTMYKIVQETSDSLTIATNIHSFLNAQKKEKPNNPLLMQLTKPVIDGQIKTVTSKWMLNFIKTDPKNYLSKITCPFLALNGSKDVQVISQLNLNGIKSALQKANNKDAEFVELDGFNHLFQKATTGSVQEYATIEETFSEDAMVVIKDWILKRF